MSRFIASDGNSTAITPAKRCMFSTYRTLGVCRPLIQSWDVASYETIKNHRKNMEKLDHMAQVLHFLVPNVS